VWQKVQTTGIVPRPESHSHESANTLRLQEVVKHCRLLTQPHAESSSAGLRSVFGAGHQGSRSGDTHERGVPFPGQPTGSRILHSPQSVCSCREWRSAAEYWHAPMQSALEQISAASAEQSVQVAGGGGAHGISALSSPNMLASSGCLCSAGRGAVMQSDGMAQCRKLCSKARGLQQSRLFRRLLRAAYAFCLKNC